MTDTGDSGAQRDDTRFLALDAMRGVAALFVLVLHSPTLFGFTPGSGYLAVDLFFVLSGFVIAKAYDARIEHGLTVRSFMVIRLIRFYPMYLVGLAIATALSLLVTPSDGAAGLTPTLATKIGFSLFLLPTPPFETLAYPLYPLNGAAWSLGFELIANLAFALAWRQLTLRRLTVLALIFAGLLLWSAIEFGAVNAGAMWSNLWGGFPRVGYAFIIGVVIARLYPRLRQLPQVNVLVPLGLTLLVLWITPPPAYRVGYDVACATIVLPLLVVLGAIAKRGRGEWVQTELGRMSYGIYVTHVSLLMAVTVVLDHLRFDFGIATASLAPWSGLLFAGAIMVFAAVLERIYDRPVRKYLTTAIMPRIER